MRVHASVMMVMPPTFSTCNVWNAGSHLHDHIEFSTDFRLIGKIQSDSRHPEKFKLNIVGVAKHDHGVARMIIECLVGERRVFDVEFRQVSFPLL